MNKIITISREFGSGGREFGRLLAENLNIAYYDQEIIREISKRTKLAEQYVEQIVEKKPIMPFPIHTGCRLHSYSFPSPILEQHLSIMMEQSKIIRDMAEKSDCVIVGRCGDDILEQFRPYRIFIYAELEHRVKRCLNRCTEDEAFSPSEMEKKILSVDKNRKKYYEFYTGKSWGNPLNYDLCINTTNVEPSELMSLIHWRMLSSLAER